MVEKILFVSLDPKGYYTKTKNNVFQSDIKKKPLYLFGAKYCM